MSKPLIGITTSHTTNDENLPYLTLGEAYVAAVRAAGGLPVLIPLGLSEEDLASLIERLDGVVFSGGGDMEPACYGGQPHTKVYGVDKDRDRVELKLYQEVFDREKPFLGICRGIQVLNVALGGTLYEDIMDQHEGGMKHSYWQTHPRSYLAHMVQVSEDSRLASILGKPVVEVNSLHHQGLREIAPSLQVTAVAPDGIVEGVELPGHPFGMGVQWHPESLQEHEPMRAIFRALVQAAQENQATRQ